MSAISKAIRLHCLVQLLQTKKHYLTAAKLAAELQVTERTVYRYLLELDKLGFAVYHDDRGYKLYDSKGLPSPHITKSDLKLFHLLARSSPFIRLPNVRNRLEALIQKLKIHVTPDETEEGKGTVFEFTETVKPSKLLFNMAKLEKAVNQNRECSIRYHSLDESHPSDRIIHPYVITIRDGNWYLIAYSPEREDYRTFRLERIQHIVETGKQFQRRSDFNLNTFFKESLSVYRGDAIQLKLRLFGKAARLASESSFPDSIRFTWDGDQTAFIEGTLQGKDEILQWILRMKDEVSILEPESLRTEYIHTVKAMLKNHNSPDMICQGLKVE